MTMKDFYRYQTGEKIRFSTEVPEVGSIYRSNGPLPYVPSYTKIGFNGVITIPAVMDEKGINVVTPEQSFNYEMCEYRITINGYYVCDAPMFHDNGKRLTTGQRQKFCKAVIWQLQNDEGSLRDLIATFGTGRPIDLIREIPVIIAVPEVIAVSAPIVPVLTSPMELSKEDFDKCFKLVNPVKSGEIDPCPVLSIEEITGYPSAEEFEDLVLHHSINYEVDYEDVESTLREGLFDMESDKSLNCDRDNYPVETAEMWQLINPVISPVIIRQWNHGTMKITEEVRA